MLPVKSRYVLFKNVPSSTMAGGSIFDWPQVASNCRSIQSARSCVVKRGADVVAGGSAATTTVELMSVMAISMEEALRSIVKCLRGQFLASLRHLGSTHKNLE